MILYHFTNLASLEPILLRGLLASDTNAHYPMFGGILRPGVWLTTQRAHPPSMQTTKPQEVRITVELHTTRKLASFQEMLQGAVRIDASGRAIPLIKRFAPMRLKSDLRWTLGRAPTHAELTAWRHWWLYVGNMPRSAILDVDILR